MAESHTLTLIRDADFRSLWLLGAIGGTSRWLEMLVIGIFVFDVTGSAFLVASMVLLRMLPMAFLGAFGGVIAERFDRRRVLLVVMITMTLLAALQAVLAVFGLLEVWHVGLGAFVAGCVWVTDFPVRRTLLGEIAGPARTGAAMSLDIMSSSGTRMIGPIIGGVLYSEVGMVGAFGLTAVGYACGVVMLLRLRWEDPANRHAGVGAIDSLVAGFRALGANRTLVGIFVVTVIFNIWGFPFTSMIPVIGKDVLMLDPGGVGLLASAEGLGAFLGAVALAVVAATMWYRWIYFYGVALYLLLILAFGVSTSLFMSTSTLVAAGIAGAGFASMQSALVLLNSDEATRGRMMGVLSMCIGTGLIGFLHLGLMADWLGAPLACVVIGIEGLVALAVSAWFWPELLHRQTVTDSATQSVPVVHAALVPNDDQANSGQRVE